MNQGCKNWGLREVIFRIHPLVDIWEYCLRYWDSLLTFSFSKEQIWQLMWAIYLSPI